MSSPGKAGQMPEEAVKAAQKATGSTDAWCELALQAAYPALRDHFLQEFREGLLSEGAQHAMWAMFEELDGLETPPPAVLEVATRAALVSLSQPVQEEECDTCADSGVVDYMDCAAFPCPDCTTSPGGEALLEQAAEEFERRAEESGTSPSAFDTYRAAASYLRNLKPDQSTPLAQTGDEPSKRAGSCPGGEE